MEPQESHAENLGYHFQKKRNQFGAEIRERDTEKNKPILVRKWRERKHTVGDV